VSSGRLVKSALMFEPVSKPIIEPLSFLTLQKRLSVAHKTSAATNDMLLELLDRYDWRSDG